MNAVTPAPRIVELCCNLSRSDNCFAAGGGGGGRGERGGGGGIVLCRPCQGVVPAELAPQGIVPGEAVLCTCSTQRERFLRHLRSCQLSLASCKFVQPLLQNPPLVQLIHIILRCSCWIGFLNKQGIRKDGMLFEVICHHGVSPKSCLIVRLVASLEDQHLLVTSQSQFHGVYDSQFRRLQLRAFARE